MTTLITKNSSTASAVPAAGDLTQGELAVNVTDKKLYTKDSGGTVIGLGGDLTVNNETAANTVTLGLNAGVAITSASNSNTFIGSSAGKTMTGAGVQHIALGYKAMELATLGTGHTAIGYSALKSIAGTNYCTAVGNGAGQSCTTGGLSSTFIGILAGSGVTTGTQNTCIGALSNPSSATVSNEFTLGHTNITTLRCNVTSITSLSDARDKTDIVDTPYGLDFINTLQPRQFQWATRDGNIKDGRVEQGFIAQELLEAAGVNKDKLNLVYESNPNKLEASAGNLVPILVKAIQELTARVAELENN
tara:strand:+ start:75 stop:989 length:915 start_codon:yes stop_codon:yes gene_type:complete